MVSGKIFFHLVIGAQRTFCRKGYFYVSVKKHRKAKINKHKRKKRRRLSRHKKKDMGGLKAPHARLKRFPECVRMVLCGGIPEHPVYIHGRADCFPPFLLTHDDNDAPGLSHRHLIPKRRQRLYGRADQIRRVGQSLGLRGRSDDGRMRQTLRVTGEWQRHKRFGPQFAIQGYEIIRPNNDHPRDEMAFRLRPHHQHRRRAREKIIESRSGFKTLDILDKPAASLLEVGGIGKKILKKSRTRGSAEIHPRTSLLFPFRIAP